MYNISKIKLNKIKQIIKINSQIKRIFISKGINLEELSYLMTKFKLFISNDTGPLHMASAQNIYVIGLQIASNNDNIKYSDMLSFIFLCKLKLKYPTQIILIIGNHEYLNFNKILVF